MHSIQTDIQLVKTKAALHKYLSLTTGLIALAFSVVNIYLQQYDIACLDTVLGTLNLYFFWSAKRTGLVKPWHINCLLLSITAIAFYTFSIVDLRAGTSYWLLILPPIYCIFSGPKKGLAYSVLVLIPIFYLFITKSDTENLFLYRSLLNFSGAYFLTYTICYLYEVQYIKNSNVLHHMAYKDSLTNARNRHALEIFFRESNNPGNSEAQQPQLLILDIDYFKKINDKFGHEIGDIILTELSQLIQKHTSKENVYRIGGEEFLITLKNTTPIEACDMAEILREAIEGHVFEVESNAIKITVSIGVSELKQGMSFNVFLRNADKNLYHAKNQGRNIVHHDELLAS
ncbi:diguanylate cyclase [Marinomonas ushuaiensis DSM 15871]|uniref:diguanylate cyclase n=1 Tax=Marinomonas ushuaiensis DSM 15871 TaxID=1122207 RepID=X7E4C4_9GAMM|nr:GGDEF domain-containing protein [Marinomonas ushuaiensis]ETX10028.1 diguanylate cyclase [Marinomonas ushuaiensis DSM 15871]